MGEPQDVHKSGELSIQFSVSHGSLGSTVLRWRNRSSATWLL